MKKYIYIVAILVVIGVIVYYVFFKKASTAQNTTYENNIPNENIGSNVGGTPSSLPSSSGSGSGLSTPGLTIDGDFGAKTEAALQKKYGKTSVTYSEFMAVYNVLKKLIPIDPNYDMQYDKVLTKSWSSGFYNLTTNTFIIDPMSIINKNNFPLSKGSKCNEVVCLQFFLKFDK